MVVGSQQVLAGNITAAVEWWRDAGVDCAFADEATAWITPAEPEPAPGQDRPAPVAKFAAPPPPPPPRPKIGGDPAVWPKDLDAFRQWWLEEPSLDGGQLARRIAPCGGPGAPLMVLVEQPEQEDGDQLLSGKQGKLLAAMLAAMGIDRKCVYHGSVLVRHTPLPDIPALAEAGLGEVTRHHVHLAAPQRLIVFGANILPLLGNDPAQSAQSLRSFNHEGRTIPLLAVHGLDAMVRPTAKAAFWRKWLEWGQSEEIGKQSA
ncbi:hypothetical protein [Novosphingobium aquae]|uniref:DNA polymerase n=1 Tax=Novosphingobium aquae TaxID=3133435 RepID=A0ABU8S8Y1_9SPHN